MSEVRSLIKTFLAANAPSEKVFDLDGLFEELQDIENDAMQALPDGPWVGLQFIPGDEVPITIGSTNTQGKYREDGAVYIHVVDIAKLGVRDSILTRATTLRNLFRGREIGTMTIQSMTNVQFEAGAALRFEGGYMTGAFILSYINDLDL